MPNVRAAFSVEEWRRVALDTLRKKPQTQWVAFIGDAGSLLVESGSVAHSGRPGYHAHYDAIPEDEVDVLHTVVWGLINEGVIVPGIPGKTASQGWPWFYVSRYGHRVLEEEGPVPHDPTGYVAKLRESIPDLDDVTVLYVIEALECFRVGRNLPTAVMVGVAAESALERLADAMEHWLPTKEADKIKGHRKRRSTRGMAEEMRKRLMVRKGTVQEVEKLLDTHAFDVEALIRDTRNTAGHPTGTEIDRDDAYSLLRLLPRQLKLMYDLARWMQTQPTGSAP